jgi:hypothetical protein
MPPGPKSILLSLKIVRSMGVVVYACNLAMQGTEIGGSWFEASSGK